MIDAKKLKRVLLKLSGELLIGAKPFGIDPDACRLTAKALSHIHSHGIELAIVIGGGNIFRACSTSGSTMNRVPADQMGMLATLFNGIALKDALSQEGVETILMSSFICPSIAESFNHEKADQYLKEGKILIFVGGTGLPYFTTDTAAALRACEISAQMLLKATKVDGVYSDDPIKNQDATKYAFLTYRECLAKNLKIMDTTAIALCASNALPIFVFNMARLFEGETESPLPDFASGTLIYHH